MIVGEELTLWDCVGWTTMVARRAKGKEGTASAEATTNAPDVVAGHEKDEGGKTWQV